MFNFNSDGLVIIDNELRKLGSPLPDPVAKLGTAGISRRAQRWLIDQQVDPVDAAAWRRAVRRVIDEAVMENARVIKTIERVGQMVERDAVLSDIRLRGLATVARDLDPVVRANVIDALARKELGFRYTEEEYLEAFARAEQKLGARVDNRLQNERQAPAPAGEVRIGEFRVLAIDCSLMSDNERARLEVWA